MIARIILIADSTAFFRISQLAIPAWDDDANNPPIAFPANDLKYAGKRYERPLQHIIHPAVQLQR